MHPISLALQGSIAYVLIAEILIVATLFLATLWIMVRRMRLQTAAAADAPVVAAVEQISVEETPEYRELNAKFISLTSELEKNAGKEDLTAMQEKVKFLESKLLEYEILQEEIGALSQLKLENEKLKADLMKLGGTAPVASAAVPTPAPTPTPPAVEASAPLPTPDVAPSSPVISEAGDPQAEIDKMFAEFAKPGAQIPAAAAPAVEPAPPPTVAAPAPSSVEPPDLDALLKDIDALSADKNAPPKG